MSYIPPYPPGAALSADSQPVVVATDQAALPIKPSLGVSSSGSITTQNLLGLSGPATAGSSVEQVLSGAPALAVQVTGTWTGTLQVQVSIDGTVWVALATARTEIYNRGTGAMVGSITTNGVFAADVAGATKARVVATAGVTGTAVVTLVAAADLSPVTVNLPTNGNTIGAVTVSGALPAGANAIGAVTQSPGIGFGTITTQNLVPAGAATAGSAVEIPVGVTSGLTIQVSGVYTGALSLQVTVDGTNWVTVGGIPLFNVNTGTYSATIASALAGIFQANVGGMFKARVTALAAVTGTATISLTSVADPSVVTLGGPLPTGGNTLGVVTTSVGVAAGSMGKAEDAVAGSGDTGIFVLGVQRATPAANSAVGDYSELPISPANGLFVAPTPILTEPTATPGITAVAYTAGWQLGAVLTFAAALASGRGGQVVGARLLDKAKQNAALVLDLFEVSPTLVGANAAAYDITDANLVTAQWIGSIDFLAANYRNRASNSSCFGSVNGGAPILPFVTSGSANIFGVLYTTTGVTYASTSDLIVTLAIEQF